MPSPIAHSVSGYAIARLAIFQSSAPASPAAKGKPFQRWLMTPPALLYSVLVANLPDLDFVPQLVTGIRFHRGPSHSLLAALLVSGLLAWAVQYYQNHRAHALSQSRQSSYGALFVFTLGLYASHLLLDLLTYSGSGLPLLWPLSPHQFSSPWPIFPAVHHSRGLWDASHWVFISAELIYAAGLLLGLRHFKVGLKTKSTQYPSQDS